MEKRYQVFISSTKEDLEDARSEVSQALLRANCFPAAMELFPAADEGIDNYIKQKIDESDYMILILAGRYGSVNPKTGISWTEEEYDYAVSIGKPVVRLIHKSPFETLPGSKIEQEPERRAKLEAFREKVTSTRIARMWESDRELGAEVVLGVVDAQRRHPSGGWTRSAQFTKDRFKQNIEIRDQPEPGLEKPTHNKAFKEANPNKNLGFVVGFVIGFALLSLAAFFFGRELSRQMAKPIEYPEKISILPEDLIMTRIPNNYEAYVTLKRDPKNSILKSRGSVFIFRNVGESGVPIKRIVPGYFDCLANELIGERLRVTCQNKGNLYTGWADLDEFKIHRNGIRQSDD